MGFTRTVDSSCLIPLRPICGKWLTNVTMAAAKLN
jgi:hypothetical protein